MFTLIKLSKRDYAKIQWPSPANYRGHKDYTDRYGQTHGNRDWGRDPHGRP